MLRAFYLLLVVSIFAAGFGPRVSAHHRFGLTEPMPRLDGTIRLATYNVLNYFDGTDDPSLQGEYDDMGDNPGPTSHERSLELAQTIKAIDADILALQEVESLEALAHFNDTYLKGMGYRFLASEDVGYRRGVEQSVLSRFPLSDVQVWPRADLKKIERHGGGWASIPSGTPDADRTFQRSPLRVTATTPDGWELVLFVMHHKAGNAAWKREAEALWTMQAIADEQQRDPNVNIAVLGDFNAQPWDRSMQVYREAGLVDAMNMRLDPTHGYASPLRVTHVSGRVIDHVLLNGAALDELVQGSGFVLGTSAVEYDWRNEPIPSGYASDHYPVVVDFVPEDGAGRSVVAAPWPAAFTRKALQASPMRPFVDEAAAGSQSAGEPFSDEPFMASRRSGVFHVSTCANAGNISPRNRVGYASVDAARAAGKRPASCCKPAG